MLSSRLPAEVLDEANTLGELQDKIFNVSDGKIDLVTDFILNSIFVHDQLKVKQLVQNFFIAAQYRTFLVPQFSEIISEIMKHESSTNLIHNIYDALLEPFGSKAISPTRLYLHAHLIKNHVFSDELYTNNVEKFVETKESENGTKLLLFAWFAPSICRANKEFYAKYYQDLKEWVISLDMPEEIKLFMDNVENIVHCDDCEEYLIQSKIFWQRNTVAWALKYDDIDLMKEIASKPGFDINQHFNHDVWEFSEFLIHEPTIIQLAAYLGAVKCFNYLMDNGADINITDSIGRTLVQFAVARGEKDIMQRLAKIDGIDWSGTLQIAILFFNESIFLWIKDTKFNDLNQLHPTCSTIFHAAAEANNMNALKFCINQGLDINMLNLDQATPLHQAAKHGRIGACKVLINVEGADVNCCDSNGRTPLHLAAKNGFSEVVELFIQSQKFDVNATDKQGATALFLATQNAKTEVVSILIDCPEVDPNLPDKSQMTPLMYAAQFPGRDSIVKIILKSPHVDLNQVDGCGCHVLHWATSHGLNKTTKYLLTLPDLDVNTPDFKGWNSLYWTLESDYPETCVIMIQSPRVDVNFDMDGESPIHFAIEKEYLSVVEALLNRDDLDLSKKNQLGETPYELAKRLEKTNVLELFSKYGKC